MKTTTFYSYKGGLGRTLLVAWVARQLERDGHSVVALDLDLEAPGLHYKLGFARDADLGPGLVELLARFQRGDPPPDSLREWLRPVPGAQRLWLLPAGPVNTRDYLRALGVVSWEGLFRGESPQGPRFFTWLKESIASDPAPGHLLIDARTGITEMGGAALGVMADQALAIVGLSPEGLDGTRDVLQSVCAFARSVPKDPPRMGLVLSRVPWTGTDEQHQSIRTGVRDHIERENEDIGATLRVGLPLVVRADSGLQFDEHLVVEQRSLYVHSDYLIVRDWVTGSSSPATPPPALFSAGASPERLDAIRGLKREQIRAGDAVALADLADATNEIAAWELSEGRTHTAIEAMERVIALGWEVERVRSLDASGDSASSIALLDSQLSRKGDRVDAALELIKRSTAPAGTLHQSDPAQFVFRFASGLVSLSAQLYEAGERDRALRTIKGAIAMLRRLSQQVPDRYRPLLAASLDILSGYLTSQDEPNLALDAQQESVALHRALATGGESTFVESLAESLDSLSACLESVNRAEDAFDASREAVMLIAGPLEARRESTKSSARWILDTYLFRCRATGRPPDPSLVKPITDIIGEADGDRGAGE